MISPQVLDIGSPIRNGSALFPEMGVFAPPSPLSKNVLGERETDILVEQQPPQGVLVCDHAGLVINTSSYQSLAIADELRSARYGAAAAAGTSPHDCIQGESGPHTDVHGTGGGGASTCAASSVFWGGLYPFEPSTAPT